MKILYDLSYAQGGKFFSGLYEYGKAIYKELIKETEVTLLLLKDEKMDEWIVSSASNIIYLESSKWSKAYYKEIEEVSKGFDILFFPCQLNRGIIKTEAKLIFTIHDIIENDLAKWGKINKYEHLFLDGIKGKIKYLVKQAFRMLGIKNRQITKLLLKNINSSEKIISVSNYSKNEIVNRYKANPNKIEVCYSPIKVLNKEVEIENKYGEYNFMVSASRYTKNAYRTILALDKLYDEGYTRTTVIAGNLPNGVRKKIRHKDKYVLLNYVSEEELEALYKNATLFIFPSLAEGFGSPPLEAMKYGTITITSNAMSLKELYSDTIQFNPYNIDDIKNAIVASKDLKRETMLEIVEKISAMQEESLKRAVKIIQLKD